MKTARDIELQNLGRAAWKPQIRVFCCQCAAGGVEINFDSQEGFLAEVVPCTGKLDVQRLVKSFEGGADAVCIIGCPPEECKMVEGSRRATKRAHFVKTVLDEIGVGGDRIEVILPDAGVESVRNTVSDFASRIRELGPSALK